jgi:tetratricopeptide (TPR) repeat protein
MKLLLTLWVTLLVTLEPLPHPRLEGVDPAVAESITDRRQEVLELLGRGDAAPDELAAAFAALGMIYHAYQIVSAAEPCYRNALELGGEDPRVRYYLALLQLETRRFDDAAASFGQVLEQVADDPPALLRRGEALLEAGRLDEASRVYDRVLASAGAESRAAARAGLGRTALAAESYGAAAEHLEAALTLQPTASARRFVS